MNAKIWNNTKSKYEPYKLPEGSTIYENDMDKIVSCACCGKKIKYGEAYTSHRIHTNIGLGYAVCESCYFDRRMQIKGDVKNVFN